MVAVVSFFWHDEVKDWVATWQEQAEEKGPGLINEGIEKTKKWWEERGEGWADKIVASLSAVGKNKIDEWLAEKKLNQYGDDPDTMYAGGTPLYNEGTGEFMERYAYLLEKFPNLFDDLNLEKFLKD